MMRLSVSSIRIISAFFRRWGAELVHFSPLHDGRLPDGLDGLLLYGGYPELHGKVLEENVSMREALAAALRGECPVWQNAADSCIFMRKWKEWTAKCTKWQV